MTIYVALLRAVNVGGRNKIPMAELRSLLGELGFDDVATYIQSGNIVCSSPLEAGAVVTLIKTGISDRFGHDIEVMVRTTDEIASIVADFPYPQADPKASGVVFLSKGYDGELDATPFAPDECCVAGSHVYVNCPTRFANTKLTAAWIEKKTRFAGTRRNWATVLKLAQLAEAATP